MKDGEKPQGLSGAERIYQVPQERRGKALRVRTATLCVKNTLEKKGILQDPSE